MPNTYWTYAFATAVYLINIMPTQILNLKSPFQLLFQSEPNNHKPKFFGCLCFPWLCPYNSHKLQPKSKPCVFLGYSLTQSAYLCLDPITNRIYVSRYVQFVENQFPFPSLVAPPSSPSHGVYVPWSPPTSEIPIHIAPPLVCAHSLATSAPSSLSSYSSPDRTPPPAAPNPMVSFPLLAAPNPAVSSPPPAPESSRDSSASATPLSPSLSP